MRRVIVFITCLAVALVAGAGTAWAAPADKGPLPATLRAKAVAPAASPGTLLPLEGTLLDAQRRPLAGVPVEVTIAGSTEPTQLQSLTGSGGSFELYVPLPDQAPATGTVELLVSFNGTAQAAASSVTVPVRIESPPAPADAGPAQPADAPAPAATAPTERSGGSLPTSGSALIDQLIVVAAGLIGVMIVLFVIGAGLRRRRG